MASVGCVRCGNLIHPDADLRLPPWCPSCGEDLRPGAAEAEGGAADVPGGGPANAPADAPANGPAGGAAEEILLMPQWDPPGHDPEGGAAIPRPYPAAAPPGRPAPAQVPAPAPVRAPAPAPGRAPAPEPVPAPADDEVPLASEVYEEPPALADPRELRPMSRAYYHPECGQVTVVSGEEYVVLECAFRPVRSTYCAGCGRPVHLAAVFWTDTGEPVAEYRRRLKRSVPAGTRAWLRVLGNVNQGALNLNLDRDGSPAPPRPPRAQPDDLTELVPPRDVAALGQPERVFRASPPAGLGLGRLEPVLNAVGDPGSPKARRVGRVLGLACVAAGALAFAAAFRAPTGGSGQVLGAAAGTFFATVGLVALGVPMLFSPKRLAYALYPKALAVGRDGRWAVVRWNEVEEFGGHHPGSPYAFLRTHDGRVVPLSREVQDPDGLCEEVERRAAEALFAQALTTIETRQTVPFGPIGIGRYGVTYWGDSAAWDEIDGIAVLPPAPGPRLPGAPHPPLGLHLMIRRGGAPWCVEPFLTIPNRAVLLMLLDRMVSPEASWALAAAPGYFRPELLAKPAG